MRYQQAKSSFWQQTKTVFLFVAMCVFTLSILSSSVLALSEEQKKVLDSGVHYFDVEPDSMASSCGGTQLVGSENSERTWNFLVGKGLTPVQAAGAMGNLQHEGNFNPKVVERGHMEGTKWFNTQPYQFPPEMEELPPYDLAPIQSGRYAGQPGYGIVQWTSPGRKQGLQDFADSQGAPIFELSTQLDYMWQELSGPYREDVLDPIMASDDLAEVARIWQESYEVGSGFAPRYEAAQEWLALYGSNTGGVTSNGPSACAVGGSVVGGFSLPTDRHWYDEHPDWFTKPHHDYPAADIPVPAGTPIYSMTSGVVVSISNEPSRCGLGVTVEAAEGIRFSYCHGSDAGTIPGVQVGGTVSAGQLLMHSNNTGNSFGDHLHVGLRVDNVNTCPQDLFVGIAAGTPPDIRSLPKSGCTY